MAAARNYTKSVEASRLAIHCIWTTILVPWLVGQSTKKSKWIKQIRNCCGALPDTSGKECHMIGHMKLISIKGDVSATKATAKSINTPK